jgi:hypothetical protein
MPQHLPKLPVTLEIPFAAHGCASRIVSLGVEKNPVPSSRRICTNARSMLLETAIEIDGPSNRLGTCDRLRFPGRKRNSPSIMLGALCDETQIGERPLCEKADPFFLRAGDRRV